MTMSFRLMAVAGVLSVALATTAVLAAAGTGADGVQRRLEKMKQGLGLSDDQAARIEAILRDAAAQREALKAEGAQRGPRGQEYRQKVREQIDAVLDADQRAKRDQMIAAHRRGGRRGQTKTEGESKP